MLKTGVPVHFWHVLPRAQSLFWGLVLETQLLDIKIEVSVQAGMHNKSTKYLL
jgi:hypothetical protein